MRREYGWDRRDHAQVFALVELERVGPGRDGHNIRNLPTALETNTFLPNTAFDRFCALTYTAYCFDVGLTETFLVQSTRSFIG